MQRIYRIRFSKWLWKSDEKNEIKCSQSYLAVGVSQTQTFLELITQFFANHISLRYSGTVIVFSLFAEGMRLGQRLGEARVQTWPTSNRRDTTMAS